MKYTINATSHLQYVMNSKWEELYQNIILSLDSSIIQDNDDLDVNVPLTDPTNSSIKRSSTAASINAIIQKPQKLTTFCIPESQIVISPPPKEFETTSTKIKSPLPSALSSSSSSSIWIGSSGSLPMMFSP